MIGKRPFELTPVAQTLQQSAKNLEDYKPSPIPASSFWEGLLIRFTDEPFTQVALAYSCMCFAAAEATEAVPPTHTKKNPEHLC